VDTSTNSDKPEVAPSAGAQPRAGALPGAEFSNTAPDNYRNGELRVLRQGIDSLYLSFSGELNDQWRNRLLELKAKAQSDDLAERALAQVKIGSHLFEVADRGSRFYTFVLRDNALSVSLSKGGSLPVAYIQVRSEYLAHAGLGNAVADCRFVVSTLAKKAEPPLVSRADLCVDYVPPCPMDGWDHRSWVTRAHVIRPHYVKHRFSGWSIGEGGAVVARIYDKVFEIATKSCAVHLFDLWRERGMQDGDPVFRAEGQFRREFLKECGIHTPEQLGQRQGALWLYFTQEWLRLTIPDPEDSNQSRWPNHPFWTQLSAVRWEDEQVRLKRFRPVRIPRDEQIFPAAAGYLCSFMAREGIEDFSEGLGTFVRGMRHHMDVTGRPKGKSCDDLLSERVAAKGRLYNTLDNRSNDPDYRRDLERGAARYQHIKSGEDDGDTGQ
jgi:hypothetical protein